MGTSGSAGFPGIEDLHGRFHMDWDLVFATEVEAIEDFAESDRIRALATIRELEYLAGNLPEKRIRRLVSAIAGPVARDLGQPRWANSALWVRDRIAEYLDRTSGKQP
ncbi:hypothetical protein [Nocardiopsis coralliicola]